MNSVEYIELTELLNSLPNNKLRFFCVWMNDGNSTIRGCYDIPYLTTLLRDEIRNSVEIGHLRKHGIPRAFTATVGFDDDKHKILLWFDNGDFEPQPWALIEP